MKNETQKNSLRSKAREIFLAGVERVKSEELMFKALVFSHNHLRVRTDSEEFAVDLEMFKKIKVVAIGKAASSMYMALEKILGERIDSGIIISKSMSEISFSKKIKFYQGSHPVPDEKSIDAGKALLEFCENSSEDELVIGLISGGSSSLAESLGEGLVVNDLVTTTRELLKSGASIHEMNCVRKHLSKIKGGNLSKKIFPAISLNFILSDVVGDDFSVIASGPTAPDSTTFQDALNVISKYKLHHAIPENIISYLQKGLDGLIVETLKVDDEIFQLTKNVLVGSNKTALRAARDKAIEFGFETIILSDKIQGDVSEAALKFYSFSREIEGGEVMKLPACIIAGGETTVKVQGSGLGGRNQEMALNYLSLMNENTLFTRDHIFLSASTDGEDGPTDCAGAYADNEMLQKARELGLDLNEYLDRNDSYHFFEKVFGHLKTGATQTNVCDLQILIIR